MSLVPAKCTNCGGNLQTDNTKDAAICPYCGSAFIVEKAITNYNIDSVHNLTNNIYAHNISIPNNMREFNIVAGALKEYKGESVHVIVPNNVNKIDKRCFFDSNIQTIRLPNSMQAIGWSAFENCRALKSISLPAGISKIEAGTFQGCTELTEVILPKTIKEIGVHAFAHCSSLKNILLPPSVIKIGYGAFLGCESLEAVNIPNSVVELGENSDWAKRDGVFEDCTSLKIVSIPESVKVIYDYTFRNCSSLEAVNMSHKVQIFRNAFDNVKGPVKIGNKLVENGHLCSGSCYIATYVYGSYDCPQVWTLRRFRDHFLNNVWWGKLFVKCYYAISPTLIKCLGKKNWFRFFWKKVLDNMVHKLNVQGFEDTEYDDI